MAGLFIWSNNTILNKEVVDSAFGRLGYKNGKLLMGGDYQVMVFPKSLYEIKNWFISDGHFICGIGTFGYKGKFYDHSLPLILKDIKEDMVDYTSFWGSFIILASVNGQLMIIRDGAGLTRLYIDKKAKIISSSFAAIIEVQNKEFNFDPLSAAELLTTGALTGDDTLLTDIKRLNINSLADNLNIKQSTATTYTTPANRAEALSQQIQIANMFIEKVTGVWFNYFNHGYIDLGMTGGMDSRLMAILTLKHTSRVTMHTHWRNEQMKNDDFKFAHIFAEKANLIINTRKVTPSMEMTAEELELNFEKAYCLSDGVIRPGAYWDEEYSTKDYRSNLCSTPYFRFLGFGGEQYRNGERLPQNSSRNLKSWIRWEMIYQFAGRHFLSEDKAIGIENRIETNLTKQFGSSELFLNLNNYKLYIQMVQSPSYRSLQAMMENRLGFCLNPFLDVHLSVPSMMAIPFLGKSLNFQLDMMKFLSQALAAIPNGYGFDFTRGEPITLKLGAILWQNLPPQIKHTAYARYKNYYRTNYIPILEAKHTFIRELINLIGKLNLPINIEKHKLVRSRSKLMLNLAYFLFRNKNKINF